MDETIGLRVAPYRDREQSRRPHRPIGLLELAGEAPRRHDIADAPDAGVAALAIPGRAAPRAVPGTPTALLSTLGYGAEIIGDQRSLA